MLVMWFRLKLFVTISMLASARCPLCQNPCFIGCIMSYPDLSKINVKQLGSSRRRFDESTWDKSRFAFHVGGSTRKKTWANHDEISSNLPLSSANYSVKQ